MCALDCPQLPGSQWFLGSPMLFRPKWSPAGSSGHPQTCCWEVGKWGRLQSSPQIPSKSRYLCRMVWFWHTNIRWIEPAWSSNFPLVPSTPGSFPDAFPSSAPLLPGKPDKTFSSSCLPAKSKPGRSGKGMRGSSSSCGAPLGGAGEFLQRAETAAFPKLPQQKKLLGSPCEPAKAARGRQPRALVRLGSLGPSWGHSWQALRGEGTRAGCAWASAPVRARPSGYPEPCTRRRTSSPGFGGGEPICAR